MRAFDFLKRQIPLPKELPGALIEASHRKDSKALARLCELHRDEILRSFPTWQTVPEELRRNEAAQDKYCKGLIEIAVHFKNSGDSSLIQLLMGGDAENPLVQWERDLNEARALMDNGRSAEAIPLLHRILERTHELKGNGVEFFKPRTLGSLGAAYFRSG